MAEIVKNTITPDVRCRDCGRDETVSAAGATVCLACGASLSGWPGLRHVRRVALIAFGLGLHGAMGMMIWLVPPGTSPWAWALYLGVGILGFLHIYLGYELGRRDRNKPQRFNVEAELGNRDSRHEDIPLAARRCASCGHSLAEILERGGRTCPGCRRRFTLRDLGSRRDDSKGELLAVAPREIRVSGRVLIAVLVLSTILAALIIAWLIAGSLRPTGP